MSPRDFLLEKIVLTYEVFLIATHRTKVYFPEGRVLYADYSTVVEQLSHELYSKVAQDDESAACDVESYRTSVSFNPNYVLEPNQLDQPRSCPSELRVVTIVESPDDRTWNALYCPRRKELLGPFTRHNIYRIQETFELVSDSKGLLHLANAMGLTSPIMSICGVELTDNVIPFHQEYCWPGREDTPEPLADRDLYAEWNTGIICRNCLCHPFVLNVEKISETEASLKQIMSSPLEPPSAWRGFAKMYRQLRAVFSLP